MALKTSLSAIMIMMLVALFAFTTSFTVYTTFVTDNNGTYDSAYNSFYNNISSSYNDTVDQSEILSDENLVTSVFRRTGEVVFGGINIFIIGLSAVTQFFAMIPILETIITSISDLFPQFNALFGLLVIIISFYIAMRFIKSARGSTEDI